MPQSAKPAVDEALDAPSRRERAGTRSLGHARERAEQRVQRILEAARELMNRSDNDDFTVQQVVELSGESLRSFYLYFAGKHELLLALFEDSVRASATHLVGVIEGVDDPLERLRVLTAEYYGMCRPGAQLPSDGVSPRAVEEFAQQLFTEHPREASAAFEPIVALMHQVLEEAAAAGAIRDDLDHREVAGVVLQSIMFNTFATTISGRSNRADAPGAASRFFDLLLHGLGART